MGKLAIVILAGTVTASAQSAADFEQRVRAAMTPGLEKQRASVQKQAALALPVANLPSSGFFTVPWPSAAPMVAPVEAACDPLPKEKLDPLVEDAAKREGVQTDLVQAVIDEESGARPCAVSRSGAQGMMQLMPATASEFGVKDPFDPKENIDAGTRLLKQLLTKYGGDVSLALGAYNAGSARVDREGGIPSIPETINYVNDILNKAPGPAAGVVPALKPGVVPAATPVVPAAAPGVVPAMAPVVVPPVTPGVVPAAPATKH
jgi:soluble lytic murein transglycosylase-like protein